jgi:hypothetical protein
MKTLDDDSLSVRLRIKDFSGELKVSLSSKSLKSRLRAYEKSDCDGTCTNIAESISSGIPSIDAVFLLGGRGGAENRQMVIVAVQVGKFSLTFSLNFRRLGRWFNWKKSKNYRKFIQNDTFKLTVM